MKYNLQFFAEEDVSGEVVDPQTEDVETKDPEDSIEDEPKEGAEPQEGAEPEDKPVQTPEENARFAAARREEKARREAVEGEMHRLNAEITRRFGNCINPITKEPVTDIDSYLKALDAQKQLQTQQQLQQAGVDPNLLTEAINNSPAVRQAQALIEAQQAQMFKADVDNQIATLHEMDSAINTVDDLLNMENYSEFRGYVDRGFNFVEAYKLVNYGKVSKQSIEAAKQAAINQAKSTSHLESTSGVHDDAGNELVDIPANELAMWKEYYPELSDKELKAKYNHSLHL